MFNRHPFHQPIGEPGETTEIVHFMGGAKGAHRLTTPGVSPPVVCVAGETLAAALRLPPACVLHLQVCFLAYVFVFLLT